VLQILLGGNCLRAGGCHHEVGILLPALYATANPLSPFLLWCPLCVLVPLFQEDFKVKGKGRCTCLSWNPSRRHPAMIAVGCAGGDSNSSLQVWDMEDGK